MNMRQAIDVFAHSFAVQRSFTHPYEVVREGKLTVMRDAPRTRKDAYRTTEFLINGLTPHQAVTAVKAGTPHGKYLLSVFCKIGDNLNAIRDNYKALGYRLMRTEPFMVHDLSRLPDVQSTWEVQRVTTPDEAERVSKQAGRQLIRPEHLSQARPHVRVYFVEDKGKPVAWVCSIQRKKAATYVSHMYVQAAYRRKGIASALMRRMLADDAHYGARHSVLLASTAGALLYRTLGYTDIGLLQLYAPRK